MSGKYRPECLNNRAVVGTPGVLTSYMNDHRNV